jgi:hypothetical protein
MPPDGTFLQVSAGQYHTCGIRTDNTLVCWGYNLYGQVGKVPDGEFKQVDAGYGHACAITTDNRLYCWGRNDYGQASVPMPAAPGGGYDFEGFYPPVGSPPVLNEIGAGSAVPLKFGLGGDKGLDVMESGYPRSAELDCTELEPVGDVQATSAAGKSALAYDPATERYSYVWKTDKAWGGTCRVLVVRLSDGSQHFAAFRFK